MARILFGIIAAIASVMLADGLICDSCGLHVLGKCINPSEATCPLNSTECFTTLATFPSLNSSFAGIRTLGCTTSTACNATTVHSSLLGVAYQTSVACCSTDKCNAIASGAPAATKLSLTLGAAVLASVWGTAMIY